MNDDGNGVVVPFGKYRGHRVDEIRTIDPGYLEWLVAQAWLAEKYREVHAAIATARGSEDSPEHNAMQVRFLDAEFLRKFSDLAFPDLRPDRLRIEKRFDRVLIQRGGWKTVQIPDYEEVIPDRVAFEVMGGWDVGVITERGTVYVECKPSVGDDFTGIPRQMKKRCERTNADSRGRTDQRYLANYLRETILLVDRWFSTNVTPEQIKAVFDASCIRVFEMSEVEEKTP